MKFNVLDVIILMFIMIEIMQSISKGFTSSILGIINILLSLYLAKSFSSEFSIWLMKNTDIYKSINASLSKGMKENTKTIEYLIQVFNFKKPDVAAIFVYMASFLIIFLISTLIINIFKNLIVPAIKRSKLRHIDKFGGAIFGAIKASLILCISYAVIFPLTSIISDKSEFGQVFFNSFFTNIFLKNNFIMMWIKQIKFF